MKLDRTYNRLAGLLALLGVTSYCAADENLVLGILAVPTLIVGWRVTGGPGKLLLPRLVVNLLLTAAIAYVGFKVLVSVLDVTDVAELVVFILLLKLGDRRSARDEAQILSLSVFLAIAAMLTSNALIVGLQILVFIPLLIVTAMVFQLYAGQERADRQRARGAPAWATPEPPGRVAAGRRSAPQLRWLVALASLGAGGVALFVFLIVPRNIGENSFGYWLPRAAGSVTGFSDRIRLGTRGLISESPRIVMDVAVMDRAGETLGGPDIVYYLRGAVLDRYHGGAWTADRAPRATSTDAGPGEPRSLGRERAPWSIHQAVTMRSLNQELAHLFAVWRPVEIEPRQRVRLELDTDDKTVRIAGFKGRGVFAYDVYSSPAEPRIDDESPRTPAYFPSTRIAEAARELLRAEGVEPDPAVRPVANDVRAASAIQQFLREGFAYTLDEQAVPPDQDPIEWFLFETRQGHCEYFASAMAAMCRSVGIDARVVTGYVAAEYNEAAGAYTVRESNAHAWVEAELGRGRWRRFDPTPPGDLARIHRPALGILGRVRQLLDAVEYLWNSSVVSFDEDARKKFLDTEGAGGGLLGSLNSFAERLRIGGPRLLLRSVLVALAVFAAVAAAGMAVSLVTRRWRGRRPRARRLARGADPDLARRLERSRFYEQFLAVLERRGFPKPAWRPPLEHAAHIARSDAGLGSISDRLASLYYKVRFGPGALSDAEVRAAADLLAAAAQPGPPLG